jgi:hypothetical protein
MERPPSWDPIRRHQAAISKHKASQSNRTATQTADNHATNATHQPRLALMIDRERADRKASPTAGILDSESVKAPAAT